MPLDQTANFQRAEITDGFPMAAEDGDVYFNGADEFPDPANGEYNLVIFDQTQFARPDQDPNVEIVRATSRLSIFELAVDRGQEGTTAADHPAGSAVLLAATSKMFDDVAATDQPVENFTTNSTTVGEVLTSNGSGGVEFAPASAASITRNGNEIEYVALDTANLPAASDSGDVALVTGANEYVQDLSVSQPFDITVAELSKSINSQISEPRAITFKPDGTLMYEVGFDTAKIYQSALSTPFDIGTATFQKTFDSADGGPTAIAFKPDGTRMFDMEDNGTIHQYLLSTPFDIGSASFDKQVFTGDADPQALFLNADGSSIFIAGNNVKEILEYPLPSPYDIGSSNLYSSSARIAIQDSDITGLSFNNDGTRLFEVSASGDKIYESALSTGFDIDTATFQRAIDTQDNNPEEIAFSSDGGRLFEIGSGADKIYQSNLRKDEWTTI